MGWEPTEQQIEEKLIEMAYTWGDVEATLKARCDASTDDTEACFNLGCVLDAFRVEAVFDPNDWGDPCSYYVLMYDVSDADARKSARLIEEHGLMLRSLIGELAHPWHTRDLLIVRSVARGTPVEGQICRRLGEAHPGTPEPTLDQLPPEQPPPHAEIGFEQRERVFWLTPIEAKFYDAAREVGLFFAVQPWIQGTDRKYRPDFIFFYDGRGVVVELDGHEYHKTREQRTRDADRQNWFEERGLRVVRFTGSQVHADVQGCVSQLLNILRGAQARP